MNHIHELKELFELSYELYEESAKERHSLHEEEWELNISPLGEVELFSNDIAGVAHSICNGKIQKEHLGILQNISIAKIPHYKMVKKYPRIVKSIENWERIRTICIEAIKNAT